MTITAIGFANKFYTLWQIIEETKPLGNGHNYVVTHFNYIKNISFDKETALAKYPNATLDENLRGKTISWKTEKEIWENVDTFRFGKYKYQNIEKTNDINYTAWYWENVFDEEHKKFVGSFLKKNGYEIRNWEGETTSGEYLVSPEDLAKEAANLEGVDKILNICKNNAELELNPTRNLDEFGEYREGDVIYKFNNFKEMYYQGYIYGLPMDSKGKTKRIKNKTLKIVNYTYELNNKVLTISINDFNITK